MLNKYEMKNRILRMLKNKTKDTPEIREHRLQDFTAAYNLFCTATSQYMGKTVYMKDLRIEGADLKRGPRSCEIYDLRQKLRVNAGGWIDAEIIAVTDCMYNDIAERTEAKDGITPLQRAIALASSVTFTAIEGRDSFEVRAVYPKIGKTAPFKPVEVVGINVAGTCAVDLSPNPYIEPQPASFSDIKYADPSYGDLMEPIVTSFFETLVAEGLSSADNHTGDFTESTLHTKVLVNQSGTPVTAIVYATEKSVTFDARVLASSVGATRSFTVVAYDTGIVEVQFEFDVERSEDSGEYEAIRHYDDEYDFCDTKLRWNSDELSEQLREIFKGEEGGEDV